MEEQVLFPSKLLCCVQVGSTLFTANNKDIDLLCIFDSCVDNKQEIVPELKKAFPGFTDYIIKSSERIKHDYCSYYIAQLIAEKKLSPIYGVFPVAPNPSKMLELALNSGCFLPGLSYYEKPEYAVKSFLPPTPYLLFSSKWKY